MTLKKILNQQLKVDRAREVLRDQERKLEAMAKELKGRSGLLAHGDSVFKVSVGYGAYPQICVQEIGDKSTIAAALQ
jgi:hypothetical protein